MKTMSWIWMVAALPLALMALMLAGFWVLPSWANVVSAEACVLVLAGALLTGLSVLALVLGGWLRGAYTLKRGDILAATAFASLDVLIPTTLALFLWWLLHNWKNSGGGLIF
jgi:hypothetical protein